MGCDTVIDFEEHPIASALDDLQSGFDEIISL